jgi:hypothetical protein
MSTKRREHSQAAGSSIAETSNGERSTLELAYRAARQTEASDFEVSLAVQRVQARMRIGQKRGTRRGPLLALALSCFAGLAFAAERLSTSDTPASTTTAEAADRVVARTKPQALPAVSKDAMLKDIASNDIASKDSRALGARGLLAPLVGKEPSAQPSVAETNSVVEANTAAREPTSGSNSQQVDGTIHERGAQHGSAQPDRPARGSAPQVASWTEVAEAMNQGDQQRAGHALRSMASSGDAETRHKALLGLAQLAAGRGDCQTTTRLRKQLELLGAANATLRTARELSTQCAPR